MRALARRISRILLQPKQEWILTIAEAGEPRRLLFPYVAVLAALLPLGQLFAGAVVGESVVFLGRASSYRAPILPSLVVAALTWGALVGVWLLFATVIRLLAPSFSARQDADAARKLAAYASTPVWLAGAVAALATVHEALYALYVVAVLAGTLWSWYLLYTGLPILLGTPDDKALAHSVVAALATAIASAVLLSLLYSLAGALLL